MTERSVEEIAALSRGASAASILAAALRVFDARAGRAERLIDVGCGNGDFFRALGERVGSYVGVDLVLYEHFPSASATRFLRADLNGRIPLEDAWADAVVSIETIEHLENPRALMRELARLVRPGGLVLITTPNQLSLLSKLTLLIKNRFSAFTDGDYPAHITALLEADLRRMAAELHLQGTEVAFTDEGRIPGTGARWPRALGFRGRLFSDNLVLSAIRAEG